MALQSLTVSDQATAESADAYHDRRKRLVKALHELKSSISRVEQQHPYLRNDLSYTCDIAISSLQHNPYLQDIVEATEAISAPPPAPKIRPMSLALDRTGAFIITGLDKMGDGIIFLFAKIGKAL